MTTDRMCETGNFSMGQLVCTPSILDMLEVPGADRDFGKILADYQLGIWGHCCPDDARANDWAVDNDARILASYRVADIDVWIITEADRSTTTILLPMEY